MGTLVIQYRIAGVRDPEERKSIIVEHRSDAMFFWRRGHRISVRTAYAYPHERRDYLSKWQPKPLCKDPIDEDLSWQEFVKVMQDSDGKAK